MNKKFLFISSIILIICFSAGIFTAILTPSEKLNISDALPSLAVSIINYIKSDILTVLAALIFSGSVFFLPLVPLMIFAKTFSLGFSAAYILSSAGEGALGILLAALLPRAFFKIPAYIVLVILSLETASFVKHNHQSPAALKHGARSFLAGYLFCFLILAISSLLEAFLLQGVL